MVDICEDLVVMTSIIHSFRLVIASLHTVPPKYNQVILGANGLISAALT